MENLTFTFKIINSQDEFMIAALFDEIQNISKKISFSLLQSQCYEIPFPVDSTVFEKFIKYLDGSNKTPEIKINELPQFIRLAEHFELESFQQYLNDKKDIWNSYQQVVSQILGQPNQNVNVYLFEQISQRLDDYLINAGDLLLNAPIQFLYNIFYHPKRELKNEDIAYKLISKHFEDTKNAEILILIPSLHFDNLTEETIKESILKKEYHEGMIPEISFKFFSEFYHKQDEQEKKINELTENVNKLLSIVQEQSGKLSQFEQINQLINNNKQNIDQYTQKFTEMQNELNDHNKQVDQQYLKLQNELNDHNKQVDQQYLKFQNELNDHNKQLHNEVIQSKTDYNAQYIKLDNQVNQYNQKFTTFEETIHQLKEQQLQTNNLINDIILEKNDDSEKMSLLSKQLEQYNNEKKQINSNILTNQTQQQYKELTDNIIASIQSVRNDFDNFRIEINKRCDTIEKLQPDAIREISNRIELLQRQINDQVQKLEENTQTTTQQNITKSESNTSQVKTTDSVTRSISLTTNNDKTVNNTGNNQMATSKSQTPISSKEATINQSTTNQSKQPITSTNQSNQPPNSVLSRLLKNLPSNKPDQEPSTKISNKCAVRSSTITQQNQNQSINPSPPATVVTKPRADSLSQKLTRIQANDGIFHQFWKLNNPKTNKRLFQINFPKPNNIITLLLNQVVNSNNALGHITVKGAKPYVEFDFTPNKVTIQKFQLLIFNINQMPAKDFWVLEGIRQSPYSNTPAVDLLCTIDRTNGSTGNESTMHHILCDHTSPMYDKIILRIDVAKSKTIEKSGNENCMNITNFEFYGAVHLAPEWASLLKS